MRRYSLLISLFVIGLTTVWAWTGKGTQGDPYLITSISDLDALADNVNNKGKKYDSDDDYPDGYFFQLSNDIRYSPAGSSNYTAIGTKENPFCGTFDGQGHTISGIKIYNVPIDTPYQGLFGYVSGGTVKNVIVANSQIVGKDYIAGIVGCCKGGTVSNCVAYGTTVLLSTGQKGGIIACNEGGTISGNGYRDCNVQIGGIDKTDGIGYYNVSTSVLTDESGKAEPLYALGLGTYVNASGAVLTFVVDETTYHYCAPKAEITISFTARETDMAEGNNLIYYNVIGMSGTPDFSCYGLADGWSFTMPAADMYVAIENISDQALAILDDDSSRPEGKKNTDYISQDGSNKKVILQGRKLYQDGEWNTICLPFRLDAPDLAASSLAGAMLMELDVTGTYDTDKQTGFDATTGTLYLFFKSATSIIAGTPYIIKWGNPKGEAGYLGTTIDSPVFAGVTISNDIPTTIMSADQKVSFKGTYSPVPFASENRSVLFLGGSNNLYYPDGTGTGITIGACRAYFELSGITAGDPSTEVKEIRLNFGEDDADGIGDAVRLNDKGRMINDNSVYDLSGRKVVNGRSSREILVQKGKKFLK